MARLKFRNDPTRAEAFRRWALVRLHGASNKPVSDLLARLVESDAVRTSAKSGVFRIEVVLDRDYERAPGRSDSPSRKGIAEATTVWSRHSLESLLLEPTVLATWVRAYAGDACPSDISDIIVEATQSADANQKLNDAAEAQLIAKLQSSDLRDEKGKSLGGEQKTVHAYRKAKELVKAGPAVWQRGKDRGQHVLGIVRDKLPTKLKNQFPTNVVVLVERTPTDPIGSPADAVPQEVSQFLDHLVQP